MVQFPLDERCDLASLGQVRRCRTPNGANGDRSRNATQGTKMSQTIAATVRIAKGHGATGADKRHGWPTELWIVPPLCRAGELEGWRLFYLHHYPVAERKS